MGTDDYTKALQTAEKELEEIDWKIELLEQRRAQLQQIVSAMKILMNVAQDEEFTLTETIKTVLKATSDGLTAADVLKGVMAMGAKFGGKNAIDSVVTILSRLHKEGILDRDQETRKYHWRRKTFAGQVPTFDPPPSPSGVRERMEKLEGPPAPDATDATPTKLKRRIRMI